MSRDIESLRLERFTLENGLKMDAYLDEMGLPQAPDNAEDTLLRIQELKAQILLMGGKP